LVKIEIICDGKMLCFLSNSIFNRFADTNAISIPEKNAENKRVEIIIIRKSIFWGKLIGLFVERLISLKLC